MSEGMAAPSAPAESSGSDSSESSNEENKNQESESQSAEPKREKETKQKTPPKMRKIKVDGKEEFVDEEQVWRDFQKYKASDKRMQEAARLKAEAEEKYTKLKSDPLSVLLDENLGLDPEELGQKLLEKYYERQYEEIDPRDKEMKELQKRLADYEQREKQAQEEAEMTERERFIESRKEALSKTLAEAMESTVLSQNPETSAALLREMALYMRAAKEAGEDVSPAELAQHIEGNRFRQFHMLANQFEGQQLIDFLGKDVLNKIRKADLESLRSKRQQPTQTWKPDTVQPREGSKAKHTNINDIRFALRNME